MHGERQRKRDTKRASEREVFREWPLWILSKGFVSHYGDLENSPCSLIPLLLLWLKVSSGSPVPWNERTSLLCSFCWAPAEKLDLEFQYAWEKHAQDRKFPLITRLKLHCDYQYKLIVSLGSQKQLHAHINNANWTSGITVHHQRALRVIKTHLLVEHPALQHAGKFYPSASPKHFIIFSDIL